MRNKMDFFSTFGLLSFINQIASRGEEESKEDNVIVIDGRENTKAVLKCLAVADHPLTKTEISEQTDIEVRRIGGYLNALLKRGHVKRNKNEDGTFYYYEVTADGKAQV